MKLMYGNTPVKSLNLNYFEQDTNDATLKASDLQAGVTAYAKGQKVTGTGKCFSFATYGIWETNLSDIIPMIINIVLIGSVDYPIRMIASFDEVKHYDFSVPHDIAEVIIDGIAYPISVVVQDGEFLVSCEKTIDIFLFIGKDEYID